MAAVAAAHGSAATPGERQIATLQVCRYMVSTAALHDLIGPCDFGVSSEDLARHAVEALRSRKFMAYTVVLAGRVHADQLCFVPQDGWCDILGISTNGWRRHHGDHRRGLNEILSDLAAAVACARLRILSATEMAAERDRGVPLAAAQLGAAADLARARATIEAALQEGGLDATARARYILCISEAASNMLLHGGGGGTLCLRRLDDRLRTVVVDHGPGLQFTNWIEPPRGEWRVSMGYGLKMIFDNLDAVGLHTGESGTTLLLDHMNMRGR